MSWKTQGRDSKGRFTSKKVDDKPKRKPRVKKVSVEQKTQITGLVLDQSSSMNWIKQPTINGFNEVLEDTVKSTKENNINSIYNYVLFGSMVTDAGISPTAPFKLDNNNYYPSGMTALYDGIKSSIDTISNYIVNKKITNYNVVITILTDGEENKSKTSLSTIKKLIQEKIEAGWMINFVGAGNLDQVIETSKNMGIFAANTVNYTANEIGTTDAFKKVSRGMKSYTSSVAAGQGSNVGFFAD
jgi:hypothetical protein